MTPSVNSIYVHWSSHGKGVKLRDRADLRAYVLLSQGKEDIESFKEQ